MPASIMQGSLEIPEALQRISVSMLHQIRLEEVNATAGTSSAQYVATLLKEAASVQDAVKNDTLTVLLALPKCQYFPVPTEIQPAHSTNRQTW
jgi:hypothetical protein